MHTRHILFGRYLFDKFQLVVMLNRRGSVSLEVIKKLTSKYLGNICLQIVWFYIVFLKVYRKCLECMMYYLFIYLFNFFFLHKGDYYLFKKLMN